ncbi:MAG: redoxin domain-containing protein [Epsilonproteobacteria bacterium]|nr:redoxin domain-containing protein [Campylobacterota bacterium]
MKEKLKHYIKEVVLFFIFITIVTNLLSFYKATDLNKENLQEQVFTLIDSEKYTLPKNKPIIIHFWATWCRTCKMEVSNIQTLSKNFEVLSIAVKSGTDTEIKSYMDKNNLNYKVLNDKDGYYATKFKINAYPTTFIYDKNKNLVFSEVGYTSTLGLWLRMWWIGL